MAEASEIRVEATLDLENTDPWVIRDEGKCDLKENHKKSFKVDNFSITNLDACYPDKELVVELILLMAKLTGLIETSKKRGTGFIQRIRFKRGKCPCHEGQASCKENAFAILTVTTVVHILSDQEPDERNRYKINQKPKSVKMILNYNNADQLGEKIYCWKFLETDMDIHEDMDWCCVDFVTHDLDLAQGLEKDLTEFQEMQATVYTKFKDQDVDLVVVVGHPHGGIKKISLGKKSRDPPQILKVIRDTQRWGRYKYKTPTCPGNSGSPVLILGQPISGFGYWFGHPHNHSGFDEDDDGELFFTSSIGAEYINVS